MPYTNWLPAVIALAGLPCAAQPAGVAPEWETRKNLQELAQQAQKLQPVLEQVKPQEWIERGAPEAYVAQLKSTRDEIGYLVITAEALAKQPDRLTLALETMFRLQAVESMLGSLAEGIRRYQNPALADLVQGVAGESNASRDKLRQYVVDLATTREQEFQVLSQEAQRCRSMLSRPGARQAPAPKADPNK